MSEFTAMPIQMFNWVSRPDQAFQPNAAAAGAILLVHDARDERRRDLASATASARRSTGESMHIPNADRIDRQATDAGTAPGRTRRCRRWRAQGERATRAKASAEKLNF
ncbi:MAG: hypothetical protein MZV65_53510 [Chromatiales bacterium]|nr:hypothetical protein [Chromatiales bacterium]